MKLDAVKPNTVVKVKTASGLRSGRFVRLTDDGGVCVKLYKKGARPPRLNKNATVVDPADLAEVGGEAFKSKARRKKPKKTRPNPGRARKTSAPKRRKTQRAGGGRSSTSRKTSSSSGRRRARTTRKNPAVSFPGGCSLGDYVVLSADGRALATPKVFSRKADAMSYAEGKDASGKRVLVAEVIAHGE